jgi:hypothetical protein
MDFLDRQPVLRGRSREARLEQIGKEPETEREIAGDVDLGCRRARVGVIEVQTTAQEWNEFDVRRCNADLQVSNPILSSATHRRALCRVEQR